jgi:hypothetical protein
MASLSNFSQRVQILGHRLIRANINGDAVSAGQVLHEVAHNPKLVPPLLLFLANDAAVSLIAGMGDPDRAEGFNDRELAKLCGIDLGAADAIAADLSWQTP